MTTRITVMIDDDILRKLRLKQSKVIKESNSSVSFSKVLNAELRKNIK